MPAPGFQQKSPIPAKILKSFLVRSGVLIFILLILNSCVSQGKAESRTVTGTVRTENGAPLAGAIIRVQTTMLHTSSDDEGRFTLPLPSSGGKVAITAWAPGYFNGGPLVIEPGEQVIEIVLHNHNEVDHQDYQWISAINDPGQGENQACAVCHSADSSEQTFRLPVDEWLQDAHANAASNPRFQTMYSGTDVNGNQSPITRYVSKKDYGTEPLKPDPAQPYYGPGYKLDFPDTAGNCAACHTPMAAINAPYDTDPTIPGGCCVGRNLLRFLP